MMAALCAAFSSVTLADPLPHLSIGASAPAFTTKGADGKTHSLKDYAGKIVVLEWTSPVCPFTAVKYDSGAMQSLQAYAASHDIVWLSIDTAAPDRAGYLSPSHARERLRDTKSIVTQFLLDTDTSVAKRYGAKTTPSFFIIDKGGHLAYQGAMDDENAPSGAPNYVHDALESLLGGRAIRVTETAQRGCAVEY